MPGPSNSKNKGKKEKKRSRPRLSIESTSSSDTYTSECSTSSDSQWLPTPPSISPLHSPKLPDELPEPHFVQESESYADNPLLYRPFIHDPGNGKRVRDARAFLSSFFAQPPAMDDPLCAEFSQEEVLQMLSTVLPEETALILWYNKSRATSRICPACQRLYHLGDVLQDHLEDEHDRQADPQKQRPPPLQLQREQDISGLCSTLCFVLACYNYPNAIRSAWGRTADEMDDESWALLNNPGDPSASATSVGLGTLVRMTRLHDLGLAQLCLPDVDFDSEEEYVYEDAEDTIRRPVPVA